MNLIIVGDGINDIDVRYILNPFTEPGDLTDTTARFCGKDMGVLLSAVLTRFGLFFYPRDVHPTVRTDHNGGRRF